MKRLRFSKSFTLNGVFIFIALFCVSTYAFFEDMSISIGAFSQVKLPLLYVGFGCLIMQAKTIIKCLLKKNRFYTLLTLAMFCLLLIIAMFANMDATIGGSPLHYTVRLILFLVEVFLLMMVIAETGKGEAAVHFLFWYLLLIVFVNDGLLFSKLIEFRVGKYESYMVGTKFSVSYLHMNMLTLWMLCRKVDSNRKKIPWWLALGIMVGIIAVAVRIDCMTGILGCIALFILSVVMEDRRWTRMVRFTSPWVLLATVLASVIFAFVADAIMELPLMKYIVEDVLGRDTSLTGRTEIYQMYAANLQGNWLTGYGYGNGNEVSVALFGYQTMQNGLLQWVLEIGVPGTVALVVLLWQVFGVVNRASEAKRRRLMPLVALIYSYIVLGTVEANFNMLFIMWFATVYMLATEKTTISERLPTEVKRKKDEA